MIGPDEPADGPPAKAPQKRVVVVGSPSEPATMHCRHCGKDRPTGAFAAYGVGPYRYRKKQCNSCRAVSDKRGPAKARRLEVVTKAREVPCADCGGRFPVVCMDFDHLPGQAKSFNISTWYRWVTDLDLAAEIAKCAVVCANCHRVRTATRGYTGGRKPKLTEADDVVHLDLADIPETSAESPESSPEPVAEAA